VGPERRETTETWFGGEKLSYSTTLSNADGSQKESRVWYANAGGERITKYAYDRAGRLVRTDYPDRSYSATRYYPTPEGEATPLPSWEGQGEGAEGVFNNNSALGIEGWQGRAEVQLARDGKISVTKYDLAGRVAESYTLASDAEGRLHLSGSATEFNEKGQSAGSYRLSGFDGTVERTLVSSSTYDADGRLVTSKDELTGAETAYGYDATGRQAWTRSMQATDTPGRFVYTANAYDTAFGRLMRVHYGLTAQPGEGSDYLNGDLEEPDLGTFLGAIRSGPADQTYVRYEYDSQGRKTDDIAPNDSGAETWTHSVFDDQGRHTKTIYNYKPGTYPNHGAANDENIVYETVYNKYGERTQLIDAKGHSTWFEYDAFGRLYRKILDNDGDGNKEPGSADSYEEYSYDSGRGLLTKKRNYDGSTVSCTYDPETDRQTKAAYSDGYEVRFEYELVTGEMTAVKEFFDGKHIRTASYCYDNVTGRPVLVSKPEGTLRYEYNDLGDLSRVLESSGDRRLDCSYFYDSAGRLSSVVGPSGETRYEYYANGSRKSQSLPNGLETTYRYDSLLRLNRMEHRNSEDEIIASFEYEVGRSGKRMGIAETIGDSTASWSYHYDGLDRLSVAERCIGSGSGTTTYSYDEVGNRLAMTRTGAPQTATCQYNALDQLIQESDLYGTETDYLYDGNGNLTGKHWNTGQVNYAYDMRNRLSKAYNGAALPENLSAEYTYDYSGARIKKTAFSLPGASKQTSFLIDDNNLTGYSQTFSESDGQTGEIETLYVYGDDLYCQVSTNATPLDTPQYFLYDGLGSTRSLTDN